MYMHKKDLALNNLQRLICHKTQPNLCLSPCVVLSAFSFESQSLILFDVFFWHPQLFYVLFGCEDNATTSS